MGVLVSVASCAVVFVVGVSTDDVSDMVSTSDAGGVISRKLRLLGKVALRVCWICRMMRRGALDGSLGAGGGRSMGCGHST